MRNLAAVKHETVQAGVAPVCLTWKILKMRMKRGNVERVVYSANVHVQNVSSKYDQNLGVQKLVHETIQLQLS